MSTKLKLYLGRKVIESLNKATKFTPTELLPLINVGNTLPNSFELQLPLNVLEDHLGVPNVNDILKIQPDDIIKKIVKQKDRANRRISFEIDQKIFMQDVLENCTKQDLNPKSKSIVVEFSSPNIAKPFHLGHLRSTIIGNFLSNLNLYLNNKVTRLNYLGDWGTQFGFIKLGIEHLKYSEEQIRENPLKIFYDSYVFANKLAETEPSIADRARQEFNKLEMGAVDLKDWNTFLDYTKQELEIMYGRLGVVFDEYNFESMYNANKIQEVLQTLRERKIAQKSSDGALFIADSDRKIIIVKSDGSTLYLTRDIAAAIDRFNKYAFHKMLYVVDSTQSDHFNTLKSVLRKMNFPWSERLFHVRFGRIRNMSTRKGSAVFLKDILDQSKDLMVQKQIESPNTKVPIENEKISDILGVSCVIINDLKTRRQKDYDFSWDKVLQVQGDTGVKLQYTHCRLYSIEKNSGATLPKQISPELILQPAALDLIREMARFHEVLYRCNEQFEACILVSYLFQLCHHINRAIQELNVKNAEPEIASQRLMLFNSARQILGTGMNILGLQPLNEM